MARAKQPRRTSRHLHVKPVVVVTGGLALLAALLIAGSYRLEIRAGDVANRSDHLRDLRLAQLVRPLSPRLHEKIARHLLESGDVKAASKEAQAFLAPQGELPVLLSAYESFGNGDRAHAVAQLARLGNRPDPLRDRLQAFLALPDLTRAAALDPGDRFLADPAAELTTEPGRLLYSSRLLVSYQLLAPAHGFAKDLTERYPALPVGWQQLARVQLAENNYPDALKSLERARILFPTDKETYLLEARVHRAAGDDKKAVSAEAEANALK